MTGGKRKPTSRVGSPLLHKAARSECLLHSSSSQIQKLIPSNHTAASDEDSSFSFPSSQVSQPSSFQLGVSPQPTSYPGTFLQPPPSQPEASQLDTSGLTDKSLSELSEYEKSQWRQYSDPRSFFEFTGWDPAFQEEFEGSFTLSARLRDTPFQVRLAGIAEVELSSLYWRLRSNETISWARLHSSTSTKSDAAVDEMMFTWIEMKKIIYDIALDHGQDKALSNQLAIMLPIIKRKDKEARYKDAERAFHTGERPISDDGTKASDTVYEKLVECYNKYNQAEYFAPYTSIVGPSGIGKSFMVQLLAVSHGVCVVYVSFARVSAYPGRSAVADKFPHGFSRGSLEEFWKMFITASLAEVEACKAAEITPAGFYNLQTKDKYLSYQTEFANRVDYLSKRYQNKNVSDRTSNILSDITTYISSPENSNRMSNWRVDLNSNRDNGGPVMKPRRAGRKWIPEVFLCFDEARELIDSKESLLFLSLRIALRHCFERKTGPRNSWGDFFGLLLDTTSRVANFSPPAHLDSSQKVLDSEGHGRKLLPPIYQIKTMDVFVENPGSVGDDAEEEEEAGSPEAAIKLFHYGRPLWGGRNRADKSPKEVAREMISLASQKTDGNGPAKALALISYRLEFYLTNSHLAEEMVSDCLRFIAFINRERDLMRTIQPTEPILAYTAASKMINPQIRLNVVHEFVSSCFEGRLKNTGDVSEMVAALILMFAYDEKQFDDPTALPRPILVQEFLQALFGSEKCNDIAQRMNTDKDMKQLWDTGLVYFNHLVNLRSQPTQDTLKDAFSRAAAFFLPPGFPGVDIIIPVKIPGFKTMTFCAIQVKNRKHDTFTSKIKTDDMADLKSATEVLQWPQNHITIMMCLRYKKYNTQKQFDILLPKPLSKQMTRHTSKIHKAQEADDDGNQSNYAWPQKSKKLLVMAMGMEESVYESINLCGGEQTANSSGIAALLEKLLDCIPGSSFPEEAEMDHVDLLVPLN